MAARPRSAPPDQAALVARVRTLLVDRTVREVSMFGGRALLVDGVMLCSVGRGGDLLARVGPDAAARLLAEPGASPAEMGAGRAMGPGWVTVARDALATDDSLRAWVDACLAHHRTKT